MSNWEYGHACEHVTTEIPNLLLKNVQDKMKPKPNSERQQQHSILEGNRFAFLEDTNSQLNMDMEIS